MQQRFVFFNVFILVAAVVALTSLGLVMLTSTGAWAKEAGGDPSKLLNTQLKWLVVGAIACIAAAIVDYRKLQQFHWFIYFAAIILLILCFVPGIGAKVHGARRWIAFAGQRFQPSELGKLAALVALAWWFTRKETNPKSFLGGFIIPLAVVGGLILFIAPEVDLGTSALIGCTTLLVMFVAGTRPVYLGMIAAAGAGGLYAIIRMMPERTGRMLAFWNPEDYHDDAYQQIQGLIAFGCGGIEGRGLGEGRQKLLYLPFAHTDFIFPMVGEEMGLPYTLGVVFCFLLILIAGVVIATRARDRFGKLLGFGIVSLLALQAILNMGVTTMLLPNKGIPLPFISSGGSNLVFSLVGIGILISIYRRGFGEERNPAAAFFEVKSRRRISPRM